MSLLKISICIPSFNQSKFLLHALESIINQDYKNVEIIVIDGGSTDNSVNIIQKYEKYIQYWVSEKDEGQTHAINKGLAKSTGEIITYLNSDDILFPGCLKKVDEYFNKNPEADVIYGNGIWIDEDNKIIRRRNNLPFHYNTWLYGMADPFQPEVFYRRRVLEKAGYLDETYYMMMDREWWIRIANSGCNFLYVNEDLAALRKYDETKSAKYQRINDSERWRLHDKYWKGFKFKNLFLHKIYWKILNFFYRFYRQLRVFKHHYFNKILKLNY